MILYHLTMSTGDLRESPRSEVGPEAIAALQPITKAQSGVRVPVPGNMGLWVSCTRKAPGGATVSIGAGEDSIILTMAVAWEERWADIMWPRVVDTARQVAHLGTNLIPPVLMRPPLPWCAVVLCVPAVNLPHHIVGMLGDLERCIAWTLIESDC